MTFLVNMLILTLVGFGVGDRLRRFGDALLERRPPLAELLLDLRPPLGEGLLDLLPPLPLELERLRLRLEFERLLDLDLDLDRDLDLDLDLERSYDLDRLFLGDLSLSFSFFTSVVSFSVSFCGFSSIGASGL